MTFEASKFTGNRNALSPGTVLRDYVLVSARVEGLEHDELGSGAFGIVYLARHRERDEWLYAIKEFFPAESAVRDPGDSASVWPSTAEAEEALADGLTRFRREAEQLRRFRHERHVVSCVNYFEANRTAYMVMDYDDGMALSKYLRRRESLGRPFTEADLLAVAEPLLEGLAAVHRAEVLHRDIKPGNVFVRRQDDRAGRPAEPVLMDFGAAKQQYMSRHSRSNAPYTPGYAAPEQQTILGRLSPATDLYAVGALLWRMVAGGAPGHPGLMVPDDREDAPDDSTVWSPEPRDALGRSHALHRGADPMPSAEELGSGRFSGHVLRAIDRCLSINEKARPQDCAELLGLIQGEAEDEVESPVGRDAAAGARHGESSDGSSAAWGRRSLLVGGLAAAVVAVAVGAWWLVGDDLGVADRPTAAIQPDVEDVDAPVSSVTGGSAILVVETDPPGARVWIGGEITGETPLELSDVRAGTHDMILDHPDYERVELAGQTFTDGVVLNIERTLVPATGRLTVMTQPRGAWIELDGERLAEGTPVTLDGLPAGTVALRLGAEAHRPVTVNAQVPRDGVGQLEETLEPIPYGTLTLEVEPPDATIVLEGVEGDYEPGMALLQGEYRVTASLAGYRSVTRAVAVSGDTRERVELVTEPQPFTVRTTPMGARVELLDQAQVYAPEMLLPPGEYRIRVSADEYETIVETVAHHRERTLYSVRLPRRPQPFTVRVTPTDATIEFTSIADAYEPGMRLRPGEYGARVTAPGYETWEGMIAHGTEPTMQRVRLMPSIGNTLADNLDFGGRGPEMVVVPAGRLRMGCVSGQACYDVEFPVHDVTIPQAFAVSKYEVTFEDWDRCVAGGGCRGYLPDDEGWGRGRRPVINVSWNAAQDYVAWLSGQSGQTYRLLSEAEWEYVARAGTTTVYSWGNEIGSNRANCEGCGSQWDDRQTAPAGSFAANAFGVHDMHGNVWEWVEDCWNEGYAGAPADGSAWRSGDCGWRVLRGGSWSSLPRNLRSANRVRNYTTEISNCGFRVARTLTP